MSKLALKFPGEENIYEGLSFTGRGFLRFAGLKPAEIVNKIIPFVFVIAGIILFAMLIAGGFSIFVSAGNPEKVKKGQSMLTNALVGFLIIFAAYWIIQLLEFSLGIQVL